MKCPACSSEEVRGLRANVFECCVCDAIFGQCYLGESYNHVLPWLAKEEVHPSYLRYFDFTCLGSEGWTRRHGWYDPHTKLVHQIG